ncbi:zinc metallopeptidase [Ruminococcaceae bacterium OttesenSCG-928-D13]|nr:zinc metallopeptidase [Ruminococcaceae bacterium OttesenSCG-928-D13]
MYYNGGYYLWLVLVPLLLGIFAQSRVSSTFKRYSGQLSASGHTGASAARRILDDNGLQDVGIQQVRGELTDHYDPKANVVRLSESVYGSTSVAAIGVAAHECGHAVQQATGYFPMKIRSAIIPITNFGSKMAIPLLLVGVIFSLQPLVTIGLWGYLLIALFQLVTLPVEFNASTRAVKSLQGMGITSAEEQGVRQVLTAAAMTYVASLISAFTQFLRMFLIYGNRRRQH